MDQTVLVSSHLGQPPCQQILLAHPYSSLRCAAFGEMLHIWSRIHVGLPELLVDPVKPFFPSLLQFWLGRSGDLPLTICMECVSSSQRYGVLDACFSQHVDSRLLEILFAEMRRWETVFCDLLVFDSSDNFNIPLLRTLECGSVAVLNKFKAPNLNRLHLSHGFLTSNDYSDTIVFRPSVIHTSVRHLHVRVTPDDTIRSFSAIFPCLETRCVEVMSSPRDGDNIQNSPYMYPRLESITLFLSYLPLYTVFDIFRRLHFPVLKKLTLVEEPGRLEIKMLVTALAVDESYHIPVVDFRPHERPQEVDVHALEPLLSVAQEVAVCGEVIVRREPATT
ncbi:hypothetical protein EDB19DRAFT_1906527 [Suillus lakei]|nr:hypothetical protein EDB19DRAFT_1906527 [Suillus lakei]